MTPNRKKWLVVAAKLAVLALVGWAVHRTLVDAWHQLGKFEWHLQAPWLVAAGALYLLGLLPAGIFWHRVLRVLGQDAQLGETLRAYYIGHLGKYVPGKAMVVILRTALVRSHRVDTGLAAASVFFETLTMMAVGACLAAGILAARVEQEQVLFWAAIGLMLVAGLPTLPPVFRILARTAGVGKSNPELGKKLARLGYNDLLTGWVCMTASWVILALSLWATFRSMGIDRYGPIEHLASYTACVSLSMVAGFLSLIPGGLGVRDAILLRLIPLFFQVDAGPSAVASGLLRLVWLVSEIVISVILYLAGTTPSKAAATTGSPGGPDPQDPEDLAAC